MQDLLIIYLDVGQSQENILFFRVLGGFKFNIALVSESKRLRQLFVKL